MFEDKLSGRTALVTGAARRIGREISLSLGKVGVDVVIHYRSSSKEAEELKSQLHRTGVDAWTVQADFATETDYPLFVSEVGERAGGVDFLVNNASIFPEAEIDELEEGGLVKSIRVNSWAPFALTRSFVAHYEGGRVVNLLDTRVSGYDWKHSGYYFSKVLLARMTKMMAIKYAPEYTVNGVAPGLIIPPEGAGESYLEERTERVPLKRSGEELDVARAVSFLLGADFVTGQILYVDGGRNLLHELEV